MLYDQWVWKPLLYLQNLELNAMWNMFPSTHPCPSCSAPLWYYEQKDYADDAVASVMQKQTQVNFTTKHKILLFMLVQNKCYNYFPKQKKKKKKKICKTARNDHFCIQALCDINFCWNHISDQIAHQLKVPGPIS